MNHKNDNKGNYKNRPTKKKYCKYVVDKNQVCCQDKQQTRRGWQGNLQVHFFRSQQTRSSLRQSDAIKEHKHIPERGPDHKQKQTVLQFKNIFQNCKRSQYLDD